MSAVYGFDTSYFGNKDLHADLNVGGAGMGEYVFQSGFSEDPYAPQPMIKWSDWMAYVLFNEKVKTVPQQEAILSAAIAKQNNALPYDSTFYNRPSAGTDTSVSSKRGAQTIYDVISADPNLSLFKNLIDYVGYGLVFSEGPITIFAPTNDRFNEIMEWALKICYKPVSALQTLRYHILPFMLKPWEMENRKLRLHTDLKQMTIDTDWTNGQRLLMNPITTTYIAPPAGSFTNPPGDPYSSRADSWFPKKDWEVRVESAVECVNGMLYTISRPIQPADLL